MNERITPFGKQVSGHPTRTYTDELRKVPWLIIEGKTRKQLQTEGQEGDVNERSDIVTERLADLGYVDT